MLAISLFAGFFSAMAGGGGLVILPALMAAGLPPINAIATTKLQGMFGLISSTLSYYKLGYMQLSRMKLGMLLAAVFGLVGAFSVQLIDTQVLEKLLPVAMILVCCYIIFKKPQSEQLVKVRMSDTQFNCVVGPVTGFYMGSFGPGIGSFLIVAFNALRGDNLKMAVANSKGLMFAANVVATSTFIVSGFVYWKLGLSMALAQMIGAHFGARLTIKKGDKLIKPVFIVVTLGTTFYLIVRDWV